MQTPNLTPIRAVAGVLCVAAAVVLAPFSASLILAAWLADLLRSPVTHLERLMGRRAAAAAVVVLVVVAVLLPVTGLVAALVAGAEDLLDQLRAVIAGHGSLAGVLLGNGNAPEGWGGRGWAELASKYGANAWRALNTTARASARALVAVVVFVAALYTFAVDGERARRWMRERAPIPHAAFDRLARAFRETGRGLIVAGGGTALLQGAIATITYGALGLPRALLLGPLTAVCAIVPFVGTGLVWIPLAIELTATAQYGRAAIVAAVGLVNSVVDNMVRPLLARFGRLKLPAFAVLVSMLGGVVVYGAAGALLGPLVLRLCAEALAILSEAQRAPEPGSMPHEGDLERGAMEGHPSGAPPAGREVRTRA
jgi:predicted PurR-regulated permease PerM